MWMPDTPRGGLGTGALSWQRCSSVHIHRSRRAGNNDGTWQGDDRVEQIASLLCERQAAFVPAKVDSLDETFVAEVANGVEVCVEVLFRHDSERADGGQRTAVVAVQLTDTVAIDNELASLAAR
jgi:hypothetical protein